MNIPNILRTIILLAGFLSMNPSISAQLVKNTFALQETIRRKAEEAALTNCLVAGTKVCARAEVLEFYEKRAFFPVWQEEEKRKQLLEALENAASHGLKPRDYYYSDLLKLHQQPTTGASLELLGNMEILFTDAFLLYASHLTNGKLDPIKVNPNWNISRESFSIADSLINATEGSQLGKALQALAPQQPAYQQLQKALQRYEALSRQGGWKKIKTKEEKLEVGMVDSIGIPLLRKRLFISTDLPKEELSPLTYDSTLMNAVQHFQKRHGLAADGVLGKATLKALNIPVEQRIDQIRVNLERYRWLPSNFSNYLVKVNIPEFSLEVIRNGEVLRKHKVVVGKTYRQTPIFTSTMKYLVFNPTWTVPPGILSNDVIPGARKKKGYLSKKGLKVYDQAGKVVHPDSINWNSKQVYKYTYRQGPGNDNALGRVKFIFPNPHLVYIHDTPSKHLFDRATRAFSSGCMRVEQPMELAKFLLSQSGEAFTDADVAAQLKSLKPKRISLKEEPQVLVLYLTAWASGEKVYFRNDIYKRDKKLLQKLDASRLIE